jgi:hypothetical protein
MTLSQIGLAHVIVADPVLGAARHKLLYTAQEPRRVELTAGSPGPLGSSSARYAPGEFSGIAIANARGAGYASSGTD